MFSIDSIVISKNEMEDDDIEELIETESKIKRSVTALIGEGIRNLNKEPKPVQISEHIIVKDISTALA